MMPWPHGHLFENICCTMNPHAGPGCFKLHFFEGFADEPTPQTVTFIFLMPGCTHAGRNAETLYVAHRAQRDMPACTQGVRLSLDAPHRIRQTKGRPHA